MPKQKSDSWHGLAHLAVLICLLAPSLARASEASVVYVTDELRLGLYRGEQTEGAPFRTLLSGAELQVLERALMSIRVRTEDGDEGWVKTGYIVETEPARRRLPVLESEYAAVTRQLEAANAATVDAGGKIAGLEQRLKETQQGIENLPRVEQENIDLKVKLATIGTTLPLIWVIAAAVAAFSAGCLAGYLWLDRRVRRQFGGIKVY